MAYDVKLDANAARDYHKLGTVEQRQVRLEIEKIEALRNPRQRGKPLAGEFTGNWGYRAGEVRLICEIHDDQLIVLAIKIDHRGSVYKRRR